MEGPRHPSGDAHPRYSGSARAAFLLCYNLSSTKKESYQRHWEYLEDLFKVVGSAPLPATATTVSCYLGFVLDKGTVGGGSLRPCVAAIGKQHRRLGMRDPTNHPMVVATRKGYFANDSARATGAPWYSDTLPVEYAAQRILRALRASQPD